MICVLFFVFFIYVHMTGTKTIEYSITAFVKNTLNNIIIDGGRGLIRYEN